MAAPPSAVQGAAAVFALFRSILRLHRRALPPPMRTMGDTYVASEFKRHLKNSKTTQEQWQTFAREWQRYAAMLGGTADQQGATAAPQQQPDVASVTAAIAKGSGDMTEQLLEHMSPDQRQQLIKLQQEAYALGAEMLGKKGGSGGDDKPPKA